MKPCHEIAKCRQLLCMDVVFLQCLPKSFRKVTAHQALHMQ